MRKPPCKCGHVRSAHKYKYFGTGRKVLSKISPCNKCGRNVEVLPHGGVYSEPKCHVYIPMDNLSLIEHLAHKKGLV